MSVEKMQLNPNHILLRVSCKRDDLETVVSDKLKEIKKKAQLPGFRAGFVPIGLLKKRYGVSVFIEELNKKVHEELTTYITEHKINYLMQPLEVDKEDKKFDLDAESHEFDFELGLNPKIDIDLKSLKKCTFEKLIISEESVSNFVESKRREFAKSEALDVVRDDTDEIEVSYSFESFGDDNSATSHSQIVLFLDDFKSENTKETFKMGKVSDVLSFPTKDLFADSESIESLFGLSEEEFTKHDTIEFRIDGILGTRLPELDKDFFSKVFVGESFDTETDFLERVKKVVINNNKKNEDNRFKKSIFKTILDKYPFEPPINFIEKSFKKQNMDFDPSVVESLKNIIIESNLERIYELKHDFDSIKKFNLENMSKRIRIVCGKDYPLVSIITKNIETCTEESEAFSDYRQNYINHQIITLFTKEIDYEVKQVDYKAFYTNENTK